MFFFYMTVADAQNIFLFDSETDESRTLQYPGDVSSVVCAFKFIGQLLVQGAV